jgi:hypothetical protein
MAVSAASQLCVMMKDARSDEARSTQEKNKGPPYGPSSPDGSVAI